MEKIKKDYNIKITSLILAIAFFVTSTCYGIGLSNKPHLRTPLLNNSGQGGVGNHSNGTSYNHSGSLKKN